jgi:hypothetical protein
MDAASPLPAAAAGRLVERATRGRVREQQKPALGSFEMAKFANSVGTATDIVDVYFGLRKKQCFLFSLMDFFPSKHEQDKQCQTC